MRKAIFLLLFVLSPDIVLSNILYPCDSVLRPVFPSLFGHCLCLYGRWTGWTRTSNPIPHQNCTSGYYYNAKRSRSDIQQMCEDEVETGQLCKKTNYIAS